MSEQGLVAHGLACRRGGRLVFEGLSFRLGPGDALVLTGRNGSGKSSLLRLLAGLVPAHQGDLVWNGRPVAETPDQCRMATAYVGHLDAIKPTLSAFDNIAFWARLKTGAITEAGVFDALAAYDLIPVAELPGRYLSAGQRRRLALARLLVEDARLWLLDEPTIALDTPSIALLESTLARHRAAGGLVVLATHTDLEISGSFQLDIGDFAVDDRDMAWGDL